MKIAQALNRRKDLLKAFDSLVYTVVGNAYVEDGASVAAALEENRGKLKKAMSLRISILELSDKINKTNHQIEVVFEGEPMTLSQARSRRDALISMSGALNSLPTSKTRGSYDKALLITLDVDSIKSEADDYARQARELDDLIQSTNWLVDLVD